MKLKNKTAVITGATGTIGGAIARFFVAEGCNVILTGRSTEKLEEMTSLLADSESTIISHSADVSHKEGVLSLVDFVSKKEEVVDILVLAHGSYGHIGTLETSEPEDWISGFTVNTLGTMMCVKYFLPLLKKSDDARIITFAGGGEKPLPHFTSYISSKAAILRMTETLAHELADANIAINAISPGAVDSALQQDIVKAGPERAGAKMYNWAKDEIKETAQSPEKAAQLAVFLASKEAVGLSGRNISAIWDDLSLVQDHIEEIKDSDVYQSRRIKPNDRGYEW